METLRYVVLANSLLLVVSVAYYALLRRETFFGTNRLALWLGVVAALGLPLLELPDWRPQPVKAVMQRTARVIVPHVLPAPAPSSVDVTITMPNGSTYPAFGGHQPARAGWLWQHIAVLLYGAVTLALLGRLLVQLVSLRRLIDRSEHETYTDFVLVRNATVKSPFSFFRWVVLNPDSHAPDELEQILRHERVHVRAWHSVDMLATEVVCIVLWFNPAMYLFRHLLHQTLEFAADRAVLNEGIDARSYQYNLVKVSLAGGHAGLTNHFSRSQLKSRIAMLNQPTSTRVAWLKYLALGVTTVSVATVFARHQLPAPRQPAGQVAKASVPRPRSIPEPAIEKPVAAEPVSQPAQLTVLAAALPSEALRQDSTPISPSRYMRYEKNLLYWVVTPKTSFDDLVVMKQEFAKRGFTFQLNELKYDPLNAYITRINITVVRPTGGMTQVDALHEGYKSIESVAGYVSLDSKGGSAGTGPAGTNGIDLPESLRSLAIEEESFVAQFIKKHRAEYLLTDGIRKFSDLGSGATTYPKEYFKNKNTTSSGVVVNADGSLSIREDIGAIKIFVNNEPVAYDALRSVTLEKLYAVVKKSQYNPVRKESFTSALLIYTTDDK